MTAYQTIYVETDGTAAFTIVGGGLLETVLSSHPGFKEIRRAADAGQPPEDLVALIDPARRAAAQMRQVSERVCLDGRQLTFDGAQIDTALSRAILDRLNTGDRHWAALVAFLERLAANPSPRARRHLYRWLDDRHVTICEDGSFIAHKGVRADGTSVHDGPGIVDGQPMYGHLPNEPGSTIEIDRDLVDPDRDTACSVGLHVGTRAYAATFAERLLTVKVDPADVVAVPKDSDNQKIRVCRYQVLSIGSAPEGRLTFEDDDYLDTDVFLDDRGEDVA